MRSPDYKKRRSQRKLPPNTFRRNIFCLVIVFFSASSLVFCILISYAPDIDSHPSEFSLTSPTEVKKTEKYNSPDVAETNGNFVNNVKKMEEISTTETTMKNSIVKLLNPEDAKKRKERIQFFKQKLREYGEKCAKLIKEDSESEDEELIHKYIILDGNNQLANKLRGVIGLFFMGMVTERCFLTDLKKPPLIYELNKLWKNPGYKWDILTLPYGFRKKLPKHSSKTYDFAQKRSAEIFYCEDLAKKYDQNVVSISTFTYPLHLLIRNENIPQEYQDFFPSSDLKAIELFETILVKELLKPVDELLEKINLRRQDFFQKAEEYRIKNGLDKIIHAGVQIRSEYVVWMSVPKGANGNINSDEVAQGYSLYPTCIQNAVEEDGNNKNGIYYYIATDSKDSQNVARKTFGDAGYLSDDFVGASTWDGIYDAVIDLQVVGSFEYIAITPHSSFSEFSVFAGVKSTYNLEDHYFTPKALSVVCTAQNWELKKLNGLFGGRTVRKFNGQCDEYTVKGINLQDFGSVIQGSHCYDKSEDPTKF